MEVLSIKKLKELLKGLNLNYLQGEKKGRILEFTKKAANEDKKKDDYVNYKPCEAIEILEDKYFLVLVEMEDVEENFIFSTTAFLISENDGKFEYNDIFTGVECRGKMYASSNFFETVRHYKHLFKGDMTGKEIGFLVRDDIGAKANIKIFNIFKLYINELFDIILADEEQEKALNEQIEQSKGGCFTIED